MFPHLDNTQGDCSLYILGFFVCLMATSAGPQKPAHGTKPIQDWQSLPCAGEEPDSNTGPLISDLWLLLTLEYSLICIGHLDNTSRDHYSPWQYTGYSYMLFIIVTHLDNIHGLYCSELLFTLTINTVFITQNCYSPWRYPPCWREPWRSGTICSSWTHFK